jgi:hypothetical protein
MQKDYLTRTAAPAGENAQASTSYLPTIPIPSQLNFLPKRAATMGSVRDNTGSEVIGERVILYIHGKCLVEKERDRAPTMVVDADKKGERTSSPRSTLTDIKYNVTPVRQVPELSRPHIA